MSFSRTLILSCLALALSVPAAAQDAARPGEAQPAGVRTVLELFTSQGCSSCPAADRLLGEFAQRKDTIALSMPVDYWDYLGWKDTLSSPLHTARQKAYATERGDRQVYTPQVVVNGMAHAIGSDAAAIEKAAASSFGQQGALTVPVSVTEANGRVRITVGAAKAGEPRSATVSLVKIRRNAEVAIGRGENQGRKVKYTNVVRGFVPVGEWHGEAMTIDIAASEAKGEGCDAYAVLLQAVSKNQEPGTILGAVRGPGL